MRLVRLVDDMASKATGSQVLFLGQIAGLLANHVVSAEHQVELLSRRVAELEAGRLIYLGPHESGRTYERGSVVTHGGSMWHCDLGTDTRPPGDCWTLAVKGAR